LADALHVEYAAIVEAGFTLQIDDPFLTDVFSYGTGSREEKLQTAGRYVNAINRSLRGIPRERVRLHTCYGINEGPRVHDAPLTEMVDTLFTIQAGAFSFEAANPRHEHVYHVFESVKPPRDAVLLPGVISHATSIVEHPDTIADRIVRFAELVGRENVVASADCGFSSQASYTPEIHPTIVWAKFESLAEGARRATARLWP
jgi:5-methyltetrahydropteroyltriglutamate--homocysteine methyltransferase